MAGPHHRRTLLHLGGVAAITTLGGCATVESILGMRTQELGRVVLANSIDEPRKVEIEVIRDGTVIFESSYQLDPGSSEERPQTMLYEWQENATAQKWEVRARTTTGDWQNAVLKASRGGSDDCHRVNIVAGDWPEAEVLVIPTDCNQS